MKANSRTCLSDFDVDAAHGVGHALGFDLIDHLDVRERQVL